MKLTPGAPTEQVDMFELIGRTLVGVGNHVGRVASVGTMPNRPGWWATVEVAAPGRGTYGERLVDPFAITVVAEAA